MFGTFKLAKYTKRVQACMGALGAPWDLEASRPLAKFIATGFDQKLSPLETAALMIKVADRVSGRPAEYDLDLRAAAIAERIGSEDEYHAERVIALEDEIVADIKR